ncbi:hypothetical protein AB7308_25005, partial [Escherichia coli]
DANTLAHRTTWLGADLCPGLMKADKGDIVELLFEIDKKNPLVADVITGSKKSEGQAVLGRQFC